MGRILVLAALLWLMAMPAAVGAGGQVLRLERAQRCELGQDGRLLEVCEAVSLPESWQHRLRAFPEQGIGYRLRFDVPGATPDWALHIERVSEPLALRLNGQLLQATPPVLMRQRGLPRPLWVPLPAGLLKPGGNVLELVLEPQRRGGMAAVDFGPQADLKQQMERELLWGEVLPLWMNMGGTTFALLILVIWLVRRSERVMGWFGLLLLLNSVRNVAYGMSWSTLAAHWNSWFFFAAQVLTVALFMELGLAWSERSARRWHVVTWACVGLLLAAGAVLAPRGALPTFRAWVYPMLMVAGLVPATLLWWTCWRRRDAMSQGFAFGVAAVLASGLHDYLFLTGHSQLVDQYWMPWTVPLALMAFALLLIRRMVQGLNAEERAKHELEQRVADRTRELAESHEAKSRFLDAASHDLRQPVSAIGLLVGLARQQAQEPRQRHLLDRAHEAAGALEALLKGLLDLSRLDSASAEPRCQPVPLQPLFDAMALHLAEEARQRGLRLRLRPTSAVVYSDPVLLEQVLRNLVGNAIRHTRHGGVLVGTRRAAGAWRVEIWDTGPGIPPEQQARIFEAFVQLDNPARERSRGVGLGLAIVQRAAERLRHPLSLRSRVGKGTCFGLTALDAAAPALQPVAAAGLPVASLRGRCLLLIEDDALLREALDLQLRAWGAETWVGERDTDAFALMATSGRAPDLLLTDLRLPGLRGDQLLQALRQRWPQLPALIITGDSAPDELQMLAAAGLPVLHKPFRPDMLLKRLLTLLPLAEAGTPAAEPS